MTVSSRRQFLAGASALAAGALAAPAMAQARRAAPVRAATGRPQYGTFGFDTAGMDRSVWPGDDFFAYANGGWVRATEIPADRSSWNTFGVLAELTSQRNKAIIEGAASGRDADSRKIAAFYQAYMDEAGIEVRGVEPLRPDLARIAAIADKRALAVAWGEQLRQDVDPLNATNYHTDHLFGLWVAQDFDNPQAYAGYLLQGGLWLPDRDYYLTDSARFTELRTRYKAHISTMMRLAGLDQPDARADRVMDLETKIARVHATRTESADVARANNRWPMAEFATRAPGMDWSAFFTAAGLQNRPNLFVWHPAAITGSASLVASEPLESWKDLMAFHAVARMAAVLPRAFVTESFAFNGTALSGTPQQSERWKRGVAQTNGALGDLVGKLYVRQHFPASSKRQVEQLVANIKTGFDRRIQRIDWMSPATKTRARRKLANLQVSVGYPEHWTDYSGFEVRRDDAYGNAQRSELSHYRRELAKFGRPVDRREWFMTAQEVNALNVPLANAIQFPAAILQPPFFDPAADPAVNYGAIGSVIGHEISHSFDAAGALFDENGRLANWWTEADFAHFRGETDKLAAQYDAYQAFADAHLNGRLEVDENIADVAGLPAAYDAYRLSLNGREAPVIDGFTGDQRFFLGWAQNYRSKYREPALRRAVLTDGHAPGPWRADTVRNVDAWYPAFDVQPGQQLYLAQRDRVQPW